MTLSITEQIDETFFESREPYGLEARVKLQEVGGVFHVEHYGEIRPKDTPDGNQG
jgi:hypothetical protein